MTLDDYLVPDGIRGPLDARDLAGALRELLGALPDDEGLDAERRAKLARALAFASAGEVVRLAPDAVAVLYGRDEPVGTRAVLGISPEPLAVTGEGRDDSAPVRIVFLFVTSRRLPSFKAQTIPPLTDYLKEGRHGSRLAEARSADQVRELDGLLDVALAERIRVEAALTPVTYRVYPDTPLDEVVDLMVRRELHAVPVVGEGYEVMGIITSGDALRDLLPRRRSTEGKEEGHEGRDLSARDVMTRTVMCVSEEQPLMDAATLMVNRDVEQLPVVREGELVGFLTRDAVLRLLFGP